MTVRRQDLEINSVASKAQFVELVEQILREAPQIDGTVAEKLLTSPYCDTELAAEILLNSGPLSASLFSRFPDLPADALEHLIAKDFYYSFTDCTINDFLLICNQKHLPKEKFLQALVDAGFLNTTFTFQDNIEVLLFDRRVILPTWMPDMLVENFFDICTREVFTHPSLSTKVVKSKVKKMLFNLKTKLSFNIPNISNQLIFTSPALPETLLASAAGKLDIKTHRVALLEIVRNPNTYVGTLTYCAEFTSLLPDVIATGKLPEHVILSLLSSKDSHYVVVLLSSLNVNDLPDDVLVGLLETAPAAVVATVVAKFNERFTSRQLVEAAARCGSFNVTTEVFSRVKPARLTAFVESLPEEDQLTARQLIGSGFDGWPEELEELLGRIALAAT